MKNAAMLEELYQLSLTEWREFERYQQAQDEYEAQLARVPNPDDFGSDDEYENALAEWQSITTTLLERAQELERVK
jgi:hypothetical protein